ncbi:MAG: hypothetical protein A2020_10710 [Lentisphaerae bacterium GWF2_45_14]|nr:MAG: hypothetical protein A2020_10710 [Lentisphaerae bacterium GWF2_45_14]
MKNFGKLNVLSIPLDGRNLVEASAGTGKTFAISNIYLRLVAEKDFDVNSILVVTFTEAATKELKERIRAILCEARKYIENPVLCDDAAVIAIMSSACRERASEAVASSIRKAVINFDEASIFTIHGFCSRVLRDNSFESAMLFDTELVADQSVIVKDIFMDFRRIFLDSPFRSAAADAAGFTIKKQKELASEFERKPFLELIPNKEDVDIEELEELCRSIFPEDDAIFSVRALTELVKGNKNAKKKKSDNDSEALLEGLIKFRNSLIIKFKDYLEKELPKRKKVLNCRHYSDLLTELWQALSHEGPHPLSTAVRAKYKAVMIDEFQDTDPVQYYIFNKLFGSGSHIMFMIGDPKQSIYSFRNADIFAYLDAARLTEERKSFTMDSNWRSSSGFVKALNTIFDSIKNPFVLGESISYPHVRAALDSKGNRNKLIVNGIEDSSIEIDFIDDYEREKNYMTTDKALELAAAHTASRIASLLNLAADGRAMVGDRPLKASDIAILIMKHDHCRILQKHLSRFNIPAVFQKTGDIFHTQEAAELEAVLTGILSPGSTGSLNAALATPLCALTDSEILAFVEDENRITEYEKHIERFSFCLKLWREKGFYRMFRQFSTFYSLREKILAARDGERKLTNILHLAELLHQSSIENKSPPENLLEYLSRKRKDDDCQEENELRLERDDEAIQIMTVFRSKGLQFPVVFCPFLWHKKAAPGENIIFRKDGKTCFDIGSGNAENKILAEWESLAELMRLFYVALTRAQNKCVFSWGRINQTEKTAPAYFSISGASGTPGEILDKALEIKGMGAEDLLEKLKDIETDSLRTVRVSAGLEGGRFPERVMVVPQENKKELAARTVPGLFRVNCGNGITSFSAMTKHSAHTFDSEEAEKNDEPFSAIQVSATTTPVAGIGSFIEFPCGANPGQCVHSILEGLDFSLSDAGYLTKLINQKLSEHGLMCHVKEEHEKRVLQLVDLFSELMRLPLAAEDMRVPINLKNIGKDSRVSELEFHFPASSTDPTAIAELFRKYPELYLDKSFPDKLANLQYGISSGFMHGYIDLIFEENGRYYIVDWKTNYLGPSLDYYNYEKLTGAMEDNLYILQYSLYIAAMTRFLRSKISTFSYEKHFGGVFYIFLRGISSGRHGSGVYFSRPPEEFVAGLENIFGDGGK